MKGMVEARSRRQQHARDGLVIMGLTRGGGLILANVVCRGAARQGERVSAHCSPQASRCRHARRTMAGPVAMWHAPHVSISTCSYRGVTYAFPEKHARDQSQGAPTD